MTFQDFVDVTRRTVSEHGIRGLKFSGQEAFQGFLVRAGMIGNYGIDFLEQEWDVLVLLDTCRYDVFCEVADVYPYIESVDSVNSCASHSREWTHKTLMEPKTGKFDRVSSLVDNPDDNERYPELFRTKDLPGLAYVTWNHFSRILSEDRFHTLDEVWKYAWDDNRKVVEPEGLTNSAIDVWRNNNPERMIVHYMQPHTPYRKQIEGMKSRSGDIESWDEMWQNNGMGNNMSPLTMIQRGHLSREEVWGMYVDNLHWVMQDLERLFNNLDADDVIISADHGEAFGELGCYGHRPYTPTRSVKQVPWASVDSSDEMTVQPDVTRSTQKVGDGTVKRRLEDLGYV